mgnify:CR=1 FL=1
MDRTINVTVNGEFVRKDSKNAGVQGEANSTVLHIVLSDEWAEYSKRVVWRDAWEKTLFPSSYTAPSLSFWTGRTR